MLTLTTLKLFETLELAKPPRIAFFGLKALYLRGYPRSPFVLGNFPRGPKASEYKKKRSGFRIVLQHLNRSCHYQQIQQLDVAQDK